MKTKIEFRDYRLSSRALGMEVRFIVDDVLKFLEWCGVSEMSMRRVKSVEAHTRKKNPIVDIFEPTRYSVYPKANMVTKVEGGLHYVCQHAFDILPEKTRAGFYNFVRRIDTPQRIGTYYPDKKWKVIFEDLKESYPVMDADISEGLHLDTDGSEKYSNSFAVWVMRRRNEEVQAKGSDAGAQT